MNRNDSQKALGKGLSSLLPSRNRQGIEFVVVPPPPAEGDISRVAINRITPNPDQPRREFDPVALMELTQSIERDGVLQPIIVRKTGDASWQIIAGERRWRAATSAGLKEVPAIVVTADDQRALELALIENIQREDLNPMELATTFHRMATELGMSHDQIGQKTGKERVTITNSVRLLQLPLDLQKAVATGKLTSGHARALLKFEDEQTQRDIATRCIAEGWSVRQIEQYTRGEKKTKSGEKSAGDSLDPNVKFALSELERVLGTKVRILEGSKGKGKIEIEYYSPEDLSRIYEVIIPASDVLR
jgi:ParB family transcriptional regulator, chromosome partitioning protein